MNEQLQKRLSRLENLISIQRSCVQDGYPSADYMLGMLNGLICAHSTLTDYKPKYATSRKTSHQKNVRHKNKRRKGI